MEENGKRQNRSLTVCWHSGVSGQGSWEEPSRLTWTRLCSLFLSPAPVPLTYLWWLPLCSILIPSSKNLQEFPRWLSICSHLPIAWLIWRLQIVTSKFKRVGEITSMVAVNNEDWLCSWNISQKLHQKMRRLLTIKRLQGPYVVEGESENTVLF